MEKTGSINTGANVIVKDGSDRPAKFQGNFVLDCLGEVLLYITDSSVAVTVLQLCKRVKVYIEKTNPGCLRNVKFRRVLDKTFYINKPEKKTLPNKVKKKGVLSKLKSFFRKKEVPLENLEKKESKKETKLMLYVHRLRLEYVVWEEVDKTNVIQMNNSLVNRFPNLTKLDLHSIAIEDSALVGKKIKSLYLGSWREYFSVIVKNEGNQALDNLSNSLRTLEIDLAHSDKYENILVTEKVLSGLHNLRKLFLCRCPNVGSSKKGWESLKKLEVLNLNTCKNIDDSILEYTPNIEKVELQYCDKFKEGGFKYLKKLRSVVVKFCSSIRSRSQIVCFAPKECKSIEVLYYRRTRGRIRRTPIKLLL